MKKSAIVTFFVAFLSIAAFAQNVQDGINHYYAERYQSAKDVFSKLSTDNPKNVEAAYWLGQTYIKMKDTAAAADVYQKALAANPNAPLILVGTGEIELMHNQTDAARQHFESAISLSHSRKHDDPDVLNAIGRANVDTRAGDVAYAIEKLNQAAQIDQKNADILYNLGNAYRKAHEGGQAVTSYMKATQINPSFAPSFYRMAMLYQTQQPYSDIVVSNLNSAVAADAKFAPAYLDLYYYYLLYPKDFAKAEDFANKYLANADPSVQNDYIKAQTAYVQKKYDEAISVAKNIIDKAGNKTNPRVYRLLGYSYVEKGDTSGACPYVNQFFAKADSEDIIGADYILQADACGKDNPSIVRESYLKAAKMDSVLANQVKLLNQGIERFSKAGNKVFEADLRMLSYQLRGSQSNPAELFYIGVPYYQGGQFQRADSVFQMYSKAFPDSIYGYLWSARSQARIDSTMELGTAVPAYEKLLEVASKDTARFSAQGVEAAGYLAGYYNNIKKDKDQAIFYLKKALEFDPTNETIRKNIEILSGAGSSGGSKQKTKTSPSGAVKTKTK